MSFGKKSGGVVLKKEKEAEGSFEKESSGLSESPSQYEKKRFGVIMKQSIKRAFQSVRGSKKKKKKTDLMQGTGRALLSFPYLKKGSFICQKCTRKIEPDICPCENCRRYTLSTTNRNRNYYLDKHVPQCPCPSRHGNSHPRPNLHPDASDSEASIFSLPQQSMSEPALERRSISDLINAAYANEARHEARFEEARFEDRHEDGNDTDWSFGIDEE